jgi:phosphoglycolate phosphatase-like HAD superfamily hydrolase
MDNTLSLEVINSNAPKGFFRFAVFDFDGTLSLIREGWQQIMIPFFADEMAACPNARNISKEEITKIARDFIFINTGKQTIYQCIELAERIAGLGGKPLQPLAYKAEYHRRLEIRIADRIRDLENNPSNAINHLVPGSFDILKALQNKGVTMYLASGTDEKYVIKEASLLQLDHFFSGIYGAQDDYKNFSKKIVIDRIIKENNLHGSELIGFGDGYVEIKNIKEAGGFACGVATDELKRQGIDEWKRNRLIESGADIIIPDFAETNMLISYLFD